MFAVQQGFSVPDDWVIEDEGYSGATLIRPGLERVRDLGPDRRGASLFARSAKSKVCLSGSSN